MPFETRRLYEQFVVVAPVPGGATLMFDCPNGTNTAVTLPMGPKHVADLITGEAGGRGVTVFRAFARPEMNLDN